MVIHRLVMKIEIQVIHKLEIKMAILDEYETIMAQHDDLQDDNLFLL